MRSTLTVLTEAVVIGVMNAFLIWGISFNIKLDTPVLYTLAGALIHILFEYSGGNSWWCRTTYHLKKETGRDRMESQSKFAPPYNSIPR
jgi:hypothetical protein